jgi:hypothetical protein
LLDLSLTGEPHTVLPVREAFEEPTISLRYAIDFLGKLLHLALLFATQLHRAAP